MDSSFSSHQIEDRSHVAFLKREIHLQASKLTFSERQVGEIDIIVSELCSNLTKHVGSGEVLFRVMTLEGGQSVFEILAIDKGAGMSDPKQMMRDGISTSNTLGQGLGAMERLSSLFQLFTMPGWGTVLYSKVSTEKSGFVKKPSLEIDVRALVVAKPREHVCGDGYLVVKTDTEVRMFLGDGLGHGGHAKEAIDKAKEFFLASSDDDVVSVLRGIHEYVRKTRGLVGTVAVFDKTKSQWRICGVGNILTRMYSGIEYKNYMPYNGTLGLNIPNSMKTTIVQGEKNQHLIMSSDGIRTRWELTRYPAIYKYDSLVLAASIYKDYCRYTDDASVFIAKVNAQ